MKTPHTAPMPPGRPTRSLARRAAGLALKTLAAAAAGILACEVLFRLLPFRPFSDLVRDFYSWNFPAEEALVHCEAHAELFMRPDYEFRGTAPNARYRFATGAVRHGDCAHGFRLNGSGDGGAPHGIVLGDSCSANIDLDEEDVWVSLLSRRSGKRFLNVSWGAQGTRYHVRMAEFFIPAVRPKAVILQLSSNDISDDAGPHPRALRLFRQGPAESPAGRLMQRALRRSIYYFSFRKAALTLHAIRRGRAPMTGPELLAARAAQMRNVEEIHRLTRGSGGALAVVCFGRRSYAEELGLTEWAGARRVPLLIVDESLWGGEPEDFRLLYDGHLNEAGNRRVAEDLLAALKDWPGLDGGPS